MALWIQDGWAKNLSMLGTASFANSERYWKHTRSSINVFVRCESLVSSSPSTLVEFSYRRVPAGIMSVPCWDEASRGRGKEQSLLFCSLHW